MIKAITFDFWDTIVVDDTDEPKRTAAGLASKPETRLQLLTDEVCRHHPAILPERVEMAFEVANGRFHHQLPNALRHSQTFCNQSLA